MKRLSDNDAREHVICPIHHKMDNGELRFRLVSDTGSAYCLTKSTQNNGWQKSHIHYQKREFYLVEKGFAFIALLIGGKVEIQKLSENDSLAVPIGVAHNVLMSDNALLHCVKYGTQDDDWNGCPELDELLSDFDLNQLLNADQS